MSFLFCLRYIVSLLFCPEIQGVSFILSLRTTVVPHRKPASAGLLRGNCLAQRRNERTVRILICTFFPIGSIKKYKFRL